MEAIPEGLVGKSGQVRLVLGANNGDESDCPFGS